MKKTLVVLTACMLAFGIAACGNDKPKETETEETTTVETTVEESEVEETKGAKSHGEIDPDDKKRDEDNVNLDDIKDILEEDQHYNESEEKSDETSISPRDQHTDENGNVVKPGEVSDHSKIDGYKDEFHREKEPSTDVTEEVFEYVFDRTEDHAKPDVPRKLVTEE